MKIAETLFYLEFASPFLENSSALLDFVYVSAPFKRFVFQKESV